MTPWQLIRTISARLAARTWPGGGDTVFGRVVVCGAAFPDLFHHSRTPAVAIKPGAATADPEEPGYISALFDFLIVVKIDGDAIGQNAVIGANRPNGQTSSEGRGLLEIEEELKSAMATLAAEGFRLDQIAVSDTEGIEAEPGKPFAVARTITYRASCTADRYYHPPRNLVATAGAGTVTLTWDLPPARHDRLSIILRRAAGGTAPTGPADGTGVTLSGALAVTVVDSPATGTYSYAIFAAYDETGSATAERYSDAGATGTTRLSVAL